MALILTITLNPAVDLSSEAETVRHTFKIRTTHERYDPGGGGINVARVVAELGGEAEALFLGGGETGAMLNRLLEEQGIRCLPQPVAGQTRVKYMVWERESGCEYRFLMPGPTVTADELQRCIDAVADHPADYLVASGSLPIGAPPDIYVRMAELAAARGARLVLDSSGEALRETLRQARVHLVKPSLGELERLVGGQLAGDAIDLAAAELVSQGKAEMVAVTMGRDGALLASADGVVRAPAIDVPLRSAVGAGDSFLAAMVVALSRGETAESAFRFGMAAGAATAMTPGTQLCRREDVETLYRATRG